MDGWHIGSLINSVLLVKFIAFFCRILLPLSSLLLRCYFDRDINNSPRLIVESLFRLYFYRSVLVLFVLRILKYRPCWHDRLGIVSVFVAIGEDDRYALESFGIYIYVRQEMTSCSEDGPCKQNSITQRFWWEWEERLPEPSLVRSSNSPFDRNIDQTCYCPLISGPLLSRTGKFPFTEWGNGGKQEKMEAGGMRSVPVRIFCESWQTLANTLSSGTAERLRL